MTDTGRNYYLKLAGMGARDSETRLIIPASIMRNFSLGVMASIPGIVDNTYGTGTALKDVLERIFAGGFLTLSVTEIIIKGEMVMPKSKGIGSIGEIIHIMGARNENITLNFTTDKFPGAFAGALKYIIQSTLQSADVIYVIDDLLVAAPTLLRTYELKKTGRLKSAIVGTMVLEALPVDNFGLGGKVTSFKNAVLLALSVNAVNNVTTVIPTGFRWMVDFIHK